MMTSRDIILARCSLLVFCLTVGALSPVAAAPDVFRLSAPVDYFRGPSISALTKADALRLLDVPVRLGADVGSIRYVRAGRPDRSVATCRQFAAAARDGYSFTTNFENKMAGFFVRACGLLDAVQRARPARRSFVDSPRVGVGNLDRISSAVLPGFPSDSAVESAADRTRRERRSIAGFVRDHQCRVTMAAKLELRLRCDDMEFVLQELLRADVDGDGFDDIVVLPYAASHAGTFSYTAPVVFLSQTAPKTLLVPKPLSP
jgi:hypothetical protein